MKKIYFIVLFLFPIILNAQGVIHIKGQKNINISGGITGLGKFGNVGYGQQISNLLNITGELQFEKAEFNATPFSIYKIVGTTNFNLYNLKQKLFIIASTGLFANYGVINNFEGLKSDQASTGYNWGLVGGVELEYFMLEKIVLFSNFRQSYLFADFLGNKTYTVGVGLKYIF